MAALEGNAAVVQGLYEAFARSDLDCVRATFDPEIVWLEAEGFPYADGNPYIGPDAVLEGVYERLVGEWESFSEELESILEAGENVITTGYYAGVYRATGHLVRAQFAHLWTLSGGKVVRFQQYADTLAFERAIHPQGRV